MVSSAEDSASPSSPSGRLALALGSLLALGHLAFLELLALDLFGLRLDELGRHRHRREHRLLGVVQEPEPLEGRKVGEAQGVADRHPADVELEVLRDLERERLDRDLADDLGEHAALGHADGLAEELDHDPRLDRLVQPDLLQVDVRERPLERMLLVRLEDRRARGASVEGDVEDRVEAALAREGPAQLALLDRDCPRLVAAAVDDAGDQTLLAQASRLRGAAAPAVQHFKLHSLAGHGAEV